MKKYQKIIFIVNNPLFLVSHRLGICIEAVKLGYEVHVASSFEKDAVSILLSEGIYFHQINFTRKGKNPLLELTTIFSLVSLFRAVKPDLVHLITIKPYLYGGIAARLTGVRNIVSAVAGLGILFSSSDLKYRLLRAFLYHFYKFSFGHNNQKVIFQNIDDRNLLLDWGVVSKDKVAMIRGSGVELKLCQALSEPEGVPIISFAARLLIDKGVEVFVEASRILKSRNVLVRFWLIGEPDLGSTNTVKNKALNKWEKDGLVELFGFRQDIPCLFAQSNIVTLPSFYGEGLPKVLVEAAACGRAVITTDHPGCRDAIEPGITGVLIPIRNPIALADAIEDLIQNPVKRNKMGQAGRTLAENEFAIGKIVDAHMQIYKELLKNSVKKLK